MNPELEKRGQPLFRTPFIPRNEWFIWGAVFASMVMFTILSRIQGGSTLMLPVVPALFFIRVLVGPKVTFFENGVEMPPAQRTEPPRYLAWRDCARFEWFGNELRLIPRQPGAGTFQVRVPPMQRKRLDQILASIGTNTF